MKKQNTKADKITEKNIFHIDCRLNGNVQMHGVLSSCERQCVHCNVNSQKLGYVRN